MLESTDPEALQKRMWDMLSYDFRKLLTQPQIDRVRWHMFPEVRVSQGEIFPKEGGVGTIDVPEIIKVMDLQQEKLARGLGEGHRVIHGVAGSGKTMILGYRCLHMAKLMHRPILVLCYNVALAARLRSMLHGNGIDDRVSVYSIHSWANAILKTYNFRPPAVVDGNYDAAIDMVIEKVGQGHIPRGQYGAILIDEGHDFQREWLRLIVDMVDPETNSLLLLYDDTQSIYKRTSSLGFSLKEVGIEAQGRTTILKLNYRNTEEILKFAFDFIDDYVKPTEEGDDKLPIVAPSTCGRKGAVPEVWSFPTFEAEARHVAATFARVHKERELPWSEMGVLYCHKWMGKAIADAMTSANVPFTWLQDSASKHRLDLAHDSVKLITMHSSKGLEFRTVATCGIGYLGLDADRVEEDAKLLYVAMTRATEDLFITSSRLSPFAVKLREMAVTHRGAAVS